MKIPKVSSEQSIRSIVETSVKTFAHTFSQRHISEFDDPDGTINMKIHNVFIAVLGSEIQYYTALVRSLDSSLGNMLESMAIAIARLFYDVTQSVEGYITGNQTQAIAKLLESYKSHSKLPMIKDYQSLRNQTKLSMHVSKRHDSDYYLFNRIYKNHYLIELKIGGDLDNKKARSEKEALLEQYCILSNNVSKDTQISLHFATAYNRFGEDKEWNQGRVLQFFAKDELLIGKDFWNFICNSNKGYELVIDEYKKNSKYIVKALRLIKHKYLGNI